MYIIFWLSSALSQRTFSFLLNIAIHAIQNESYLICLSLNQSFWILKLFPKSFDCCVEKELFIFIQQGRDYDSRRVIVWCEFRHAPELFHLGHITCFTLPVVLFLMCPILSDPIYLSVRHTRNPPCLAFLRSVLWCIPQACPS